jgi:type VI secretion system VgrG family protein
MKDILSVRLESPAFAAGSVELYELSGREAISQLFELELQLVSKSPDSAGIDEEALLSEPMTVIFSRGDAEIRRMFGVVVSVRDALQTETLHLAYTLTFVPRAFRMTLTETSEIFMDLTVPEIIKKKLERAGLHEGDDFELRLAASYPPREYVVQYKETDLQFVSRLAEHLGISFFFEHRDGRDVIVFSDHNSGFQPIAQGGRAHFYPRGEHMGVHRLQGTTRTIPNRYVVKDYNYRTPHVPLMASAKVSEAAAGDIVEYGAHFKTPDEGERIAAIRAEELRAGRKVYEGESDVQAFSAGARVMVEGHPRGDVELVLVEVRHRLRQGALGTGSGTEHAYANEFRAIPWTTPYRPPRVTPKPRVHGVIPGIVEAAAKSKYAELDEDGRYHVRFIFDTSGAEEGQASRPIRMAQPHAGPNYGFHFPLRSGVEVILTCIDGDPDRPIIAGAVPNPQTPSTVEAANARRNVIRTGGGNEINIDDTEGEERIKISTPYGGSTLQLGSPNTAESGAAMTTNEALTQVGISAATTVTSVLTAITDTSSVLAAGDITQFAGSSSALNVALDKVDKIAGNILGAAKSVLDIPKKYNAYQQAKAEEAAVVADEARKRLETDAMLQSPGFPSPPPTVKDANGFDRPMTIDEWHEQHIADFQGVPEARAAAQRAKKAAADRKSAVEADETNVALKGIGAAIDAASSVQSTLKGKGTRKLISVVSKVMKVAGDKSASAVAAGMVASASASVGPGRIPSPVMPVASPSCINAAVTTSAVIGMVNAFVGGSANATLASSGSTVVTGSATAVLKSPGAVEMASGVKALITSMIVDIMAGVKFVVDATEIAMKAGSIKADALSSINLKTNKLEAIVAGKTQISTGGTTDIKSGSAMSLQAGPTLDGSAAKVSFKGRSKAALEVGAWSATVKPGQAWVGGPGSSCTMTDGSAVLKCGSTVTCDKGSVTVKAPSVTIKGSGTVRLNGARIDLG